MVNRGGKPKGKAKRVWSASFAYAIGLLVTDGCLSKDGRHIDLTSKDTEQLQNFLKALNVAVKIGFKQSSLGIKYQRVQFSDVLFYRFLQQIGLSTAKSKTIGEIKIPYQYFFDFLRGCFDGDGSFYSYFDPRWRSSFMFYTVFASASRKHIEWLRHEIMKRLGIRGHINGTIKEGLFQLKYAKKESLKLLSKIYYNNKAISLTRKRVKIYEALKMDKENYAQVEKLVNSLP